MHCAICDKESDLITFNLVTHEFSDCPTCLAIIADCLGDFEEDEEYVGC